MRSTGPPSPLTLSPRWLGALFLLALVPRLALALTFLDLPLGLDDMFQYDMLGRSLAAGDGYRWYGRSDVEQLRPYLDRYYGVDLPTDSVPEAGYLTTFRPPGYPFFLAAVYAVVGMTDRLAAVRLIQALLGALLAPGTAALAVALGLRLPPARIAGAVVALYPILWVYPIGLASENVYLPALLLGLLFLLFADRSRRWQSAALAGLALGFATLTRGALVLFLPLAAAWLAWPLSTRPGPSRARLCRSLVLAAAASLVLLPWMIRNSLLLGRPAFVDNSAGYNLYVGYYPQGDGGFNTTAAVQPLRFLDDGQRDRWATAQALGFVRDDPSRAIWLLASRMTHFWGLEDRELIYFYSNGFLGEIPQPWLGAAYLWLVLPWIGVSLAAPWGMAWAVEGRPRALALALVGTTLLAYIPILAEARFHLPLVPLLAAYAAGAWTSVHPVRRLVTDLRRRQTGTWLVLAATLILIVMLTWDVARDLPRLMTALAAGGSRQHFGY